MDSKKMAAQNNDFVVAVRRDFHQNPEPSMEEFRTTDKLEAALKEMGIPTKRFDPTGVMGEIKGGRPGKTVALRADIDALSIAERSGVEFTSNNEGFMHACGHDTHAAMLLGAAKALNEVKGELPGTVRILFQPAEEIAQGAKKIIEQGALDGVDMIFGMHIFSQTPVGLLAVGEGPSAAAADIFKIKIHGRAGHGAMPETTADATVAAASIVMNLQTLVSREIAAREAVVVTVGKMNSGTRFNIISGEAELEGTVRSFNREIHNSIPGIMERIAKQTAAALKCEAEVEYTKMTEVLINDPVASKYARAAAEKIAAPELIATMTPMMGGEDFAEYTALAPAAFVGLGAGGEYPLHSDYVVLDEKAFPTGVAWYTQVAYDYLMDNAE